MCACMHSYSDVSVSTEVAAILAAEGPLSPSFDPHWILQIILINPNLFPTVADLTCLTKTVSNIP